MAFATPLSVPHRLPQRSARLPVRRLRACTPQPSSNSIDQLLQRLRQHPPRATLPSHVHLVGVGPGDPRLLTLATLDHLKTADVILYDRLISPAILDRISSKALMIYVGKQAGLHTRSQQDIHLLLAYFASKGGKVIRLKGGDPMIFGRGGEEMTYLRKQGVSVSVEPGISAAIGIAADLQLPLTMRGIADEVRFVTGHACDDRPLLPDIRHGVTYVIYMGLSQMRPLMQRFESLGGHTPVLAVEQGTTQAQRAIALQLNDVCDAVERELFQSPTLIVVGEVVRLCRAWSVAGVLHGLFQHESVSMEVKERLTDVAGNLTI